MRKALKLTSDVRSLTELGFGNFVEDFENTDLKPFIIMKILDMVRGGLTIIPQNIRYIAGTHQSLSLDGNSIAMELKLPSMVCKSPVGVKGEVFAAVFQVAMHEIDYCPGGARSFVTHRLYQLLDIIMIPTLVWCQ